MRLIKLKYHLLAAIKKICFKIIYGRKIKFGKKVTFRKSFSLMIDGKARVEIGNGVFFNNFCTISSMGGVTIGDNCIFGENVKIYDNDHTFNRYTIIKESGYHVNGIEIGNDCWLANNVIILRGTKIGSHCVIGAGAVVKGEIPDGAILRTKENYSYETIERR